MPVIRVNQRLRVIRRSLLAANEREAAGQQRAALIAGPRTLEVSRGLRLEDINVLNECRQHIERSAKQHVTDFRMLTDKHVNPVSQDFPALGGIRPFLDWY